MRRLLIFIGNILAYYLIVQVLYSASIKRDIIGWNLLKTRRLLCTEMNMGARLAPPLPQKPIMTSRKP